MESLLCHFVEVPEFLMLKVGDPGWLLKVGGPGQMLMVEDPWVHQIVESQMMWKNVAGVAAAGSVVAPP